LFRIEYINGSYLTDPGRVSAVSTVMPTLFFYRKMVSVIFRASSRAKHSVYGNNEWCGSSIDILRALESVGVKIEVTGTDNFTSLDGPCVFISNHMSTLETFVLPVIIQPYKDVTFVVKQGLVDYPVFRHVMRSRDPVTVGRSNPRDDLRSVLEGGTERLKAGRSIIIFPQTTRMPVFDPDSFNTIGVKLAKKADVPVIPIALRTDAWCNGRILKDFGRIDPSKRVHIAFGPAMSIQERGVEEHRRTVEFIKRKLEEWG